MTYVDGFVIPLAKDKLDDYKRMATLGAEVWKDHGALDYKECLIDDDNVTGLRPFAEAAGASAGETVVFAFIVYASKEDRDAINAKVMADPRLAKFAEESMPFDMQRMAYGGFQTMVEW